MSAYLQIGSFKVIPRESIVQYIQNDETPLEETVVRIRWTYVVR